MCWQKMKVVEVLKRYYGVLLIIALALVLWFGPSFDRIEETHGVLKSDRFLIGNGVLVGMEHEGRQHIMFLTCRHVLEEKMVETQRAFIDGPTSGNQMCIRCRGKGFRYVTYSNIDPARWLTVEEADRDFAWIELSKEELEQISGQGQLPSYLDLTDGSTQSVGRVVCESDYPTVDVEEGSEVSIYSLVAPVTGRGGPSDKLYWPTFLKLPFLNRFLGWCWKSSVPIVQIGAEIPIDGQLRRENLIAASIHVNNSGSPVFAQSKSGEEILVGLVTTENNRCGGGFQSLTSVIYAIRHSIEEGKGLRLIDYRLNGTRGRHY